MEGGRIACFCVHLKSNYGANKPETKAANVAKRTAMMRQVLEAAKKVSADRILIAGDFNADRFRRSFKDERIFPLLLEKGFSDAWEGLPLSARGTHPGNTRYPDSTIDYVFFRGFKGCKGQSLAPVHPVSDHRLAVMEF